MIFRHALLDDPYWVSLLYFIFVEAFDRDQLMSVGYLTVLLTLALMVSKYLGTTISYGISPLPATL